MKLPLYPFVKAFDGLIDLTVKVRRRILKRMYADGLLGLLDTGEMGEIYVYHPDPYCVQSVVFCEFQDGDMTFFRYSNENDNTRHIYTAITGDEAKPFEWWFI